MPLSSLQAVCSQPLAFLGFYVRHPCPCLHSLTVFSQCPSRFSLSTCLALCPNFCFLLGRRSYWITAYPNDLIFKNNLITSVEILFPKRSHSEALHVRISTNLLWGVAVEAGNSTMALSSSSPVSVRPISLDLAGFVAAG